jgi:hypothetical protein
MFRYTLSAGAIALALVSAPSAVFAQQTAMSDSDYIAKVMTAAPAAVVKGATIVDMQSGKMRTIQTGTNGFTCMLAPPVGEPMCADKNAMAWIQALVAHTAPPDGIGFVYMRAGDKGASNTDPYANSATADNHWAKTGSHVMIVGASVKTMGYPMTSDPDVTKPYVMWPETPYAHLMIPVSLQP